MSFIRIVNIVSIQLFFILNTTFFVRTPSSYIKNKANYIQCFNYTAFDCL